MTRIPAAATVLSLLAPFTAAAQTPGARAPAAETAYTTGDSVLDGLQRYLRPTLDANRKSFRGRTGLVQGFGAGTTYPQIWIRDSATLLGLAQYHYDWAPLASWLEEHLAHQRPEGELFDWIAHGEAARFTAYAPRARQVHRQGAVVLSADRNTTELDQESSAVEAAVQLHRLRGDAWLWAPVAGVPLLRRLDAALESVRARRIDRRLGLVTSAFTADWGDVSPAHADQRAIYLDDSTPLAAGLYTNALFYRAATGLARLHRARGDTARATHWDGAAGAVRARIDRLLWQEPRGFYRMHLAAGGPPPPLDDSDLFALGGNALAALYGLADPARARRIFDVAEQRQRRFGVTTIAGVLLPPFPRGVFKHPMLRELYSYQNGGQWDWWAGRFLLAEFERGQAARARRQLRQVAARVLSIGGLFEWATRDGHGRGSPRYAGSAGALGAAVYQGLFGLDLRADGLDVTVRLGEQRGSVNVRQPATGRRASYSYSPGDKAARVDYESNAPGRGRLRVLLADQPAAVTAKLDGRPVPARTESVGEDSYAVVETDWRPHRLELSWR